MSSLFLALAILAAAPHQTATDFEFRLRFGVCAVDVVDTANATYVHDIGYVGNALAPAMLIMLRVPTTVKQAILDAVITAGFFDYPLTFRDKADGVHRVTFPSMSYRLDVRTGDRSHAVSWQDNTHPSSPDADRLRTMFKTIIDLIKALPEVEALPEPNVACL